MFSLESSRLQTAPPPHTDCLPPAWGEGRWRGWRRTGSEPGPERKGGQQGRDEGGRKAGPSCAPHAPHFRSKTTRGRIHLPAHQPPGGHTARPEPAPSRAGRSQTRPRPLQPRLATCTTGARPSGKLIGARGSQPTKERGRCRSAPPHPPLAEKSRGASLGVCHHPACKAFLKGPLFLRRTGSPGFLRPGAHRRHAQFCSTSSPSGPPE